MSELRRSAPNHTVLHRRYPTALLSNFVLIDQDQIRLCHAALPGAAFRGLLLYRRVPFGADNVSVVCNAIEALESQILNQVPGLGSGILDVSGGTPRHEHCCSENSDEPHQIDPLMTGHVSPLTYSMHLEGV